LKERDQCVRIGILGIGSALPRVPKRLWDGPDRGAAAASQEVQTLLELVHPRRDVPEVADAVVAAAVAVVPGGTVTASDKLAGMYRHSRCTRCAPYTRKRRGDVDRVLSE
jgi:hypothetical protein